MFPFVFRPVLAQRLFCPSCRRSTTSVPKMGLDIKSQTETIFFAAKDAEILHGVRVVMTRVFELLTFYCVLTLTDCFLLKCFYRIDHTTWYDGLDCPVQHYNASPVLLKREDSGQIDSGSRHIEHIAGIRNPRRHIFSKSRHRYYQNANSTFQCQRLLKCGDINPNPGPTKQRRIQGRG